MYPNPAYPNPAYPPPPAYNPGYSYGSAPPPGWVPPAAQPYPYQPQYQDAVPPKPLPQPQFVPRRMLPPHLSAFEMQYNADESWDCNASDVPKEIGLLQGRKNDTYPQGRDNCLKFLRECQMRGYSFRVKAVHSIPYWTWYYEIYTPNQGRNMNMNSPPFQLAIFDKHYDADQTWLCCPADVPKEIGLLQSRVNDIYPQGRDNCLRFLTECQARGFAFKVKAKKTSPYWTWYYVVDNPERGRNTISLPAHLAAFDMSYDADEKWECTSSDVPKELRLLQSRNNDTFPQGRDNCMSFLRECQARGYSFKVKARHTRPYWTWFYEVDNPNRVNQVTLPAHLSAFNKHYDGDQSWDGTPADVPKELGLLEKRRNDIFPQGRDNCIKFLKECQKRGYTFKIKAVKTSPTTWYYEVVGYDTCVLL